MSYRDYDPLMGVGYFDVWMEGASFTNPASGSFAATLFRVVYDGAPGSFVVAQSGGPSTVGATNGLRWQQTAAGSGGTVRMIEARIEDATTFNNDMAMLSFYASAAQDGTPCEVEVVQFFGSGAGNPSGDVLALTQAFVADQAVALKTFSFPMPSTQSKMFGSNWDDCVKVRIKYPLATTFDVTVNELRFERGPVKTPFQYVPLSLKRAHIDRYLQVLNLHLGGNATGAGSYIYQSLPFKAHMRRVPTTSWSGANRRNLGSGGAPIVTYMKNFGGCAYIVSAAAGAFYALDEYLKMDARL